MNGLAGGAGRAEEERPLRDGEYRAFRNFLEEACGILLGEEQEYLVANRLSGILAEHGLEDMDALLRQLQRGGDPALRTTVIDAMTTNETSWFRDPPHFRVLSEIVFPQAGDLLRPLRIWSAACSSGQEPYSISIAVEEYRRVQPGRLPREVEILATDVSTRMVAEARTGIYCGFSMDRGLLPRYQRLYFSPQGGCIRVNPEIRRRVHFQELNLIQDDGPSGRFDVIFCRNVLIYFHAERKRAILERLAQHLQPGGYLFLGSTESLSGFSDRFEMVVSHGGIAYRLKESG